MTFFKHIIGQKIKNIQRLDTEDDYEFYFPYAIILTLDNITEKLIISATNEGSSVDIQLASDEQIVEFYGIESSEHILNELKKEDELCLFIGNTIQFIRIAEYFLPEIYGANFIMKQGKFAGVELKTDKHKLLFQNNSEALCYIDDDVVEISNQDRWRWI